MSDSQSEMSAQEAKGRFISNLLFETPGGIRFTQDSPILPMVWMAYPEAPDLPQELILTVNKETCTGYAARELRQIVGSYDPKG